MRPLCHSLQAQGTSEEAERLWEPENEEDAWEQSSKYGMAVIILNTACVHLNKIRVCACIYMYTQMYTQKLAVMEKILVIDKCNLFVQS